RRGRARPHFAVDRAGIEALILQRLLSGADVGPVSPGADAGLGALVLVAALHLVDDLVLRLDDLLLRLVGLLLDLVLRLARLVLDLVLRRLGLVLGLVLGPFRLVLHLVGRRRRRGLGGGGSQNPRGTDHHREDTRENFFHDTTSQDPHLAK